MGIGLTQVSPISSMPGRGRISAQSNGSWRRISPLKRRVGHIWRGFDGRKAFGVPAAGRTRRGQCEACGSVAAVGAQTSVPAGPNSGKAQLNHKLLGLPESSRYPSRGNVSRIPHFCWTSFSTIFIVFGQSTESSSAKGKRSSHSSLLISRSESTP